MAHRLMHLNSGVQLVGADSGAVGSFGGEKPCCTTRSCCHDALPETVFTTMAPPD